MRALSGLIVIAAALSTAAAAAPAAAPGFAVTVAAKPGAIYAGLAADGANLLVTDLADGRLYRRSPDGAMTAFGPLLPHGVDVIGDPTGPYRVVRRGDTYLVAEGWTPVDTDAGPLDHAIIEVDATGVVRTLSADFWNPFDFIADGDTLYVVDSARNSVERLNADGTLTTLHSFPRLQQKGAELTKLSPTEFSKATAYEVDAVPTGIALHDGRLYISLFGGFPYVQGGGVVVSLDPAGPNEAARLEVGDLNTPVGVAFDDDGALLVLEHGTFDQASGFVAESGQLLSIDPATGKRVTLLRGLTRPASLVVRGRGRMVVSELDGALIFLNAAH